MRLCGTSFATIRQCWRRGRAPAMSNGARGLWRRHSQSLRNLRRLRSSSSRQKAVGLTQRRAQRWMRRYASLWVGLWLDALSPLAHLSTFCYSVHMYSISARYILTSHQGVYNVTELAPAPQTPGSSPHCDSYQALQLTHRRNLPELDQALYPVSWQAPSP